VPEIERTFLVESVPGDLGSGVPIEQAYLARDGPVEVRVRRTPERCQLAVKSGGGLERSEVEIDLELAVFDELWELAPHRRITKTRVRIPIGSSLVAELDSFTGALEGLVLVEVEFPDTIAATDFRPPGWFGSEVTDHPGWSNASLAEHGRPDR
jgi:adenylate cyclase